MKQAMNFRLSSRATAALRLLENKTHQSKTAIIEKALELYAKKEMSHQNVLLPYAGILTDKDANTLLGIIETSKHNKDIDIEL